MASFVVVADRDGFVGAFDDLAAARAATEKYRGRIPMVYSQYPRAAPGSDTVWALPYLHAPAVAYASDCAVAAKKAQDALARLGLVPDDDDLAYWEQAMHCIVPSAQRRFDIVTGGSAEADEFHLDQFLLIIGTAPAPLDSAPADDEAAPDPPVFDPPTDDTPPEAAPDPPADEAWSNVDMADASPVSDTSPEGDASPESNASPPDATPVGDATVAPEDDDADDAPADAEGGPEKPE